MTIDKTIKALEHQRTNLTRDLVKTTWPSDVKAIKDQLERLDTRIGILKGGF
jgi:hypothetical protein